jgi:hypothetical protein
MLLNADAPGVLLLPDEVAAGSDPAFSRSDNNIGERS